MEPLQLSGLASGFDWKTVVDQLIQLERVPQNRLISQQQVNSLKLSALDDLEGRLENLADALEDLQDSDLFFGRNATIGDSQAGILSASSGAHTLTGSYSFVISGLATSTDQTDTLNVGSAISPTSDVSGVTLATMNVSSAITAGTFSVNGQSVTVDTADSLQDLFDAISTATSGAVTASYDPATDQLQLSSASAITLGNPTDTSNFLSVARLFSNGSGSVSSTSALGAVNLNSSIASSSLAASITNVDGNGDGTFTINGKSIAFNVNDDSIGEVMQRINESDAEVTINYDAVTDQFTLTNRDTGSLGLAVSETSGGFLEASGLNTGATITLGANANFTVNGGGSLTSTSNILDSSVHGITGLSVTAQKTGTESVQVASDTTGARKAIDDFISKYNAVQSFIEDKTDITVNDNDTVTTDVLSDNRDVSTLARSLRTRIFAAESTLVGAVKRLQDMGIDFKSGSSELEIEDADLLDTTLAENGDDVAEVFANSTEGLAVVLESFIDAFTSDNGTLDTQKETLNTQNANLDDQFDDLERFIENERDRLTNSFIRMEEIQSQLQWQLSVLTNSFF